MWDNRLESVSSQLHKQKLPLVQNPSRCKANLFRFFKGKKKKEMQIVRVDAGDKHGRLTTRSSILHQKPTEQEAVKHPPELFMSVLS